MESAGSAFLCSDLQKAPLPSGTTVTRFAVIDVETTGLGRADRLVEAALVILDDEFRTIDEFDTLINSRRDVGPTGIHGITASMVTAAPSFEEVAGAIAARIEGCVLVAHNLPFDVRMLAQEFARIDSELRPGRGFDTLLSSGHALEVACEVHKISLIHHHRALADAQATAALLRIFRDGDEVFEAAAVAPSPMEHLTRTLRREAVQVDLPAMTRIRAARHYPTSDRQMLAYLDALNWVLDDAVIDITEREQLNDLARDLGLDPVATTRMHTYYLEQLVDAATRDGIVTADERALLDRVAAALGVDSRLLPSITAAPAMAVETGMRVCFTGDARPWEREELEAAAARIGFQPVANVTKKGCDLLVAVDPASQSGKAGQARKWSIPIVSLTEFAPRIGLV